MEDQAAAEVRSPLPEVISSVSNLQKWQTRLKFYILPILAVVVALGVIFAGLTYYIKSTYQIKNLFFSNNTDQSVTISWETNRASPFTLSVNPENQFVFMPQLFGQKNSDDRQKNFKNGYVTLKNLQAEKRYSFAIYYFGISVYQGSFRTGSIPSSLSTPNPLNGVLTSKKGQTNWEGAVVYMFIENNLKQITSNLISSTVSGDGKYLLETGNLRDATLSRFISPSAGETYYLMIKSADGTSVQRMTKK